MKSFQSPSRLLVSILLGLGLLGSTTFAYAIQGQRFTDWGGNCETGLDNRAVCYLEQVVSRGEQVMLKVVIGYAPGSQDPRVFFELPNDVPEDQPVALRVDNGRPVNMSVHCTTGFCTAGLVLNGELKQQFLRGRGGQVSYTPVQDTVVLELPISLLGVTAGLNALR